MKKIIVTLVLLFSFLGFAQQGKIYPKNKKINQGEINTYIYKPPTGLEIPEGAWAIGQSDSFEVVSSSLVKKGSNYEFLMKFTNTSNLCLVKIIDNRGEAIDHNNYNGYTIKLNPKLAKEEISLHEVELLFFTAYNLGKEKRTQKQLDAYKLIFDTNPKFKKEYYYSDYLILKSKLTLEATKTEIIKHLDFLKMNLSEKNLYYLSQFYTILGMFDEAEKTKKILLEKYPTGENAKNNYIETFYQTSNKTENFILEKQQEYRTIFTDNSDRYLSSFQSALLEIYLKEKDTIKIEEFEKTTNNKINLAYTYNNYAWELSGQDLIHPGTDLDFAEKISKKTLNIVQYKIKNSDYGIDALGLSKTYNMFADTYALVLYKRKKYQEAFEYQHPIAEQDELDTGGKERYATYAEKVKGLEFAKNYIEKELDKGTESEILIKQLERIYNELKLPKEAIQTKKETLRKLVTENAKKEVVKLYGDIKTADFELENLDGRKIKLSDYKGKIVILDFWATWCGPCKASFPKMQDLVNEYKTHNVEFLFINTLERKSNEKVKEKVSQFIKNNNYNFNVLYDFNGEITRKYLVNGIPTKIVIDKEGNIISVDGSEENIKALIEENK